MTNSIISVKNLHKYFGNHKVLSGIDLEIEKGKSTVILGGSGTGKSVLIKTIIGLLKPTHGEILIDGKNTATYTTKEKSDMLKRCGYLFQAGALFDSLPIEDNITFFAQRLYKLSHSEKRDLAIEKLKDVGLPERVLPLYPAELSGGMQKRVALARAICTNPEIIFFDEPTTGLDPIMSNVINELISEINDKHKVTCIIITHDMNSAKLIADKVAMIYEGKIIWTGNSKELEKSHNDVVDQFVHGKTTGPIKPL